MTKKQTSDKGMGPKTRRRSTVRSTVRRKAEYTPPPRSGARMIGALVPALTRQAFRRKSPLFIRLVMDWESIVGPELAQQSEPSRFRPGVLTVRCSGPAAMEIQYAIPRILERINTACGLRGEEVVQQIKLVQDRKMTPPPPKKRAAPPRPAQVPDMEESPLREALERLGGQVAARSRRSKN